MRTLINGRKLIDGMGNAIEGAAVLIDGDRIDSVGRQVLLAELERWSVEQQGNLQLASIRPEASEERDDLCAR